MPQKNTMFDMNKYCNGEYSGTRSYSTCNNIGYSKLVTSGNNPALSNKMQFSQMLRSRKFKRINTTNPTTSSATTIPLYLFPDGYVFSGSAV